MTKKARRHRQMEKRLEIIAIDHGWSNIKTVNTVFSTAVNQIANEPGIFDNILQYEGKFYSVGGKRLEVKDNKVTDESFYLLTLAAMEKELKIRGKNSADVFLSVGLPLTRFGAEKDNFIKYLSKKRELEFKFENRTYRVNIIKVSVFPQCYAAVADKMPQYDRKHIVVDIGSWTMDLMTIKNMKPELSECDTRPMGLITCMHAINKECVAKFNCEIDESELEYVMKTGMCDMEERFAQVVEEEIRKFTTAAIVLFNFSWWAPMFICVTCIPNFIVDKKFALKIYNWTRDSVNEVRKMNYSYEILTSKNFCKDIRINLLFKFLKNKYEQQWFNWYSEKKKILDKQFITSFITMFLPNIVMLFFL